MNFKLKIQSKLRIWQRWY